MLLTGKAAIVTGGARGIGYAITENFCMEGACVAFSDLNEELGRRAAEQLTRQGHNVIFIPADVSVAADVERMVNTALEYFGRVDILVNNAGVLCDDALAEDITEEEWERMLRIDLTAPFLCCKYILPHMRSRNSGSIINISSTAGLNASRNDPPYCTAKTGVIGLTRSLACDYAPYRVRVNAICPATCETEMWKQYLSTLSPEAARDKQNFYMSIQPLGMCQPEDVAYAAVYLASDRAKFITGIALPVDGGATAI